MGEQITFTLKSRHSCVGIFTIKKQLPQWNGCDFVMFCVRLQATINIKQNSWEK